MGKRKVIAMSMKFRLKVLLAENGMTQKELSEATGIRAPTISAICLGTVKQFPIGAIEKICETLHCQPGDIMEYVPDEEQK
jgi:putative transcriptional regulator